MKRGRLGILVGPKGRGSNMRAIAEACASGAIPAEVAVVVSPKDGTPAVESARALGLQVSIVQPGDAYGPALLEALKGCDIVCLAGYLRLLPTEVLQAFPGRVLNIHPALLPKFGGKGMYGARVHEAVVAAGESESGCTVHRVTEVYDEGEVLVQLRTPISPTDTAEDVAAKVLQLEHQAYPLAIAKVVAEG